MEFLVGLLVGVVLGVCLFFTANALVKAIKLIE